MGVAPGNARVIEDPENPARYKQVDTNPLPRRNVKEVPLDGEPDTDKLYICEDGRELALRWRLLEVGNNKADTPSGTGATIRYYRLTAVKLSAAAKSGHREVVRNTNGEVIVLATHDFTLGGEDVHNMAEGQVSDFIEEMIAEQSYVAEQADARLAEAETVLAKWGGGRIPTFGDYPITKASDLPANLKIQKGK